MLVVVALAVAVIAFVIASPGSDDEDGEQAAQTATQTQIETTVETETDAETVTEAETQPEPTVTRIQIRGGQVVGGPKQIETTRGEPVRIVVAADAQDEIHLHGYDVTKIAGPGAPARFSFKANLEGVFEIESHTAEDAGNNPLVANLVVNPS